MKRRLAAAVTTEMSCPPFQSSLARPRARFDSRLLATMEGPTRRAWSALFFLLASASVSACESDNGAGPDTSGRADGGGSVITGDSGGGPGAADGGTRPADGGATGGPGMDSGPPPGNGMDSGAKDGGTPPAADTGTATADSGGGTPGKIACSAPKPNPMPGNACKNSAPPSIKLTPVATGLNAPVFVTQAPGDKTRLYVVEQRGRIRVILNGKLEATPFLDMSSKVSDSGIPGEQGLLGMAFDPNYQTTGRFWVKYSKAGTSKGDDTVSGFKATPGGNADPASEKILSEISAVHPNALRNHNGGMLAFGPDGCLYISYGDGGGSGDPPGNGQKVSDIFANILRIDVDTFPTPAAGNPQISGGNPHIWSYGLRNAWRYSFDRANGDMYIGDVGQDAWEEVDVEPAGTGGRNYGWNQIEGKGHCYGGAGCDQNGKTLPAVEYANPAGIGQASVIGGYVYRGKAMPEMVGRYIYTDAYSRKLSTFIYKGETGGAPTVCDEHPLSVDAPGNPYSFGEDLDGELYLTTANGGVYKFEPG